MLALDKVHLEMQTVLRFSIQGPAMIIIKMFPFIFPKFLATWIILSCQGWLNTEEKHSGETEYNSAQDYNHKSTS